MKAFIQPLLVVSLFCLVTFEVDQECITDLESGNLLSDTDNNVKWSDNRVEALTLVAGDSPEYDKLSCLKSLERLEKISFKGLQLSTVPESIFGLTILGDLDLSSNRLTEIPFRLSSLVGLSNLNLSSNYLTFIPFSLGVFRQLEYLDISNNLLERFPHLATNLETILEEDSSKLRFNYNCFYDSFRNFDRSQYCDECQYVGGVCYGTNDRQCELDGDGCKSSPDCQNSCLCESFTDECPTNRCSKCSNDSCVPKGFCPCDTLDVENPSVESFLCSFCESSEKWLHKSEMSACVICEKRDPDTCEDELCKYCDDELKCRPQKHHCLECTDANKGVDALDCNKIDGCISCMYTGECSNDFNDQCKNCAEPLEDICTDCGDAGLVGNDIIGNDNTCDIDCLAHIDSTECENTDDCKWCLSRELCVSVNSAAVCECSKFNTFPADCAFQSGCKYCFESQVCSNKDDECDSCVNMENKTQCLNLSWCKWCEITQECTDDEFCPTCIDLPTNAACSKSTLCAWCVAREACFPVNVSCLECTRYTSEFCSDLPGCESCKDGSCANKGSCVENAPNKEKEKSITTLVVVIIAACLVALVVVIVLLLIIIRKKRHSPEIQMNSMNIYTRTTDDENMMFEIATGIGGEEVDVSKTKHSLESMKSSLISWDDSQFPLSVNSNSIVFNESSTDLLPLNNATEKQIILTNNSSREVSVTVFAPSSTEEESISVTPSQITLKSEMSQTLTVSVTLRCTKKLNTMIYIEAESIGHAEVNISAESVISTVLSYNDLKKESTIGEGGYGIVYLGSYRGQQVAIKEMKAWGINDPKAIDEIRREVDLMRKLRSPYVVTFYGTVSTKRRMCIVMEYCQFGTVTDLLIKPIDAELKLKIAVDCAEGVKFLHTNNIMHRDLKPDNLLVVSVSPTASCCVKLTDFGSSRAAIDNGMNQNLTRGIGTPAYMAPEILSGEAYSYPCDVYSYAMVLYEIWTQHPPFSGMEASQYIDYYLEKGNRLDVPEECVFKSVVEACWKQDPKTRPKISEVVELIRGIKV